MTGSLINPFFHMNVRVLQLSDDHSSRHCRWRPHRNPASLGGQLDFAITTPKRLRTGRPGTVAGAKDLLTEFVLSDITESGKREW
jgi:hypothetical protein